MEYKEFETARCRFLKHFEQLRPVISAFLFSSRQDIIITLIQSGGTGGIRVGEIQKQTNLSRSSVSHHLKILLDARIVCVRKEGSKNYYRIDTQSNKISQLAEFWKEAEEMMPLCQKATQERIEKNEQLFHLL